MNSDNDPPQQQQPSEQKLTISSNTVSLFTILIIILFVAVLAGTGGYLLGIKTYQQKFQSSNDAPLYLSPTPIIEIPLTSFVPKAYYPVPTTDPSKTSNWKTYKSENNSFTFRYPPRMHVNVPELSLEDIERGEENIFFTTPITYNDYLTKKYKQELNKEKITGGHLIVSVYNKDYVDEFNDDILSLLKERWTDYKDENILIGGKIGRIISGLTSMKNYTREIAIPLKGKKYLSISYSENAITLSEFDQILSTFKFDNQH